MSTTWNRREIENHLDIHGDMLFLTEIESVEEISSAPPGGGLWVFSSTANFDEEFFAFKDHLSRDTGQGPLPGVFLMECMAQTAAFGLSVTFPMYPILVTQFNVALAKKVGPGLVTSTCKIPKDWPGSEMKVKVPVTSWQNSSIVGRGDLSYSKTKFGNLVTP